MAPRVGNVAKAKPAGRGRAAKKTGKAPVEFSIGAALRARRRKLELTLQQVADASGLSVAFISQAERGHAVPSIVSLMNLARALGVDMNFFIEVPKTSRIVRRAAEPEYIKADSPVRYVRLSGGLNGQQMEPLLITVPPHNSSPTVQREGEGFYYVLEGRLSLTLGDEKCELGPGDSVHFDQRHPYSMSNPGKGKLRMLWVGTPPLFD